ncbi:snRNA-activating protein complex subunit 3 [Coccinella septempunctata]|uniref:snRNA-activating protein complex subunit 3 n=1 Tax=Coccinella septempunctata TaxID=41139 RepID=UPI001D064F3C|nr:snRNA-activating protein complex subunit 3 [Coccinella septempunctata]
MESIYEPERFKATEVVNLREYFTKFSNLIGQDVAPMNKNRKRGETEEEPNLMGISIDSTRMKNLEEVCSIGALQCEGELKLTPIPKPDVHALRSLIFENLPFTQKYSGLQVLKMKAQIEEQRNCDELLLGNKENFHNCVLDKESEKGLPKDLAPGSDFLMSVVFYKPFKFDFQSKKNTQRCRFSHEIQVLGQNRLTELRDKIVCALDYGLQIEVESPTADVSHLLNAKEEYPSGCFFIDGVFYNDLRSPKAIEYSEEIIKWGQHRKVGEFVTADMYQTKLIDLSLRFGYPYVYLHQGDCEHIMVFSDAHILTNNDCLNLQQYPRLYARNKSLATVCFLCNLGTAKWLVQDYDRLPQANTYLCAKCAERYCSKDGKKIGNYKIFPIFNPN